jgi:hypothetical protein
MNNSELIYIKSREDINYLLQNYRINLVPRHRPRIVLELENLSSEENKRWSEKINASYYSCGCSEGKWFLLLGLASCFYYFFKIENFNIHFSHIIYSVPFIFIIALLGKILGILWGKYLFKKAVNRLLPPQPSSIEGDAITYSL